MCKCVCVCVCVCVFIHIYIYIYIYIFVILYFVLCGDFNIVPSYSMVATSCNMMFGIIGLLVISIFDGGSLVWFICPTLSVICLPYYLNFRGVYGWLTWL